MTFSEHLKTRGLKPWHKVWIDKTGELCTFPLWGWENRLIGYQRYNWKGDKKPRSNRLIDARYFTHISSAYHNEAVYGWNNLYGYGTVFITEGIWDSISIGNVWFDSLAILTATPSKELIRWLRCRINRPIVAVCDNDDAGKSLAKMGDVAITIPCGKDANEMSPENLRDFLLTESRRLL